MIKTVKLCTFNQLGYLDIFAMKLGYNPNPKYNNLRNSQM